MIPYLAFRYNTHRKYIRYPCYVQPKLDGVRMLFFNGLCQSRDEKLWSADKLKHITQPLLDLADTSDIVLDGELYVHGWTLQEINAAVAVNSPKISDRTLRVQYHIFDGIIKSEPNLSFDERWPIIQDLTRHATRQAYSLSLVDTHNILTPDEGETLYDWYIRLGYEGIMYRQATAPYGHAHECTNKENRWPTLIKRKDYIDEEFVIVDTELGEGKYAECVGALVFQTAEGKRFTAGSGLSDMQRMRFMDDPPIGKKATIKYRILTLDRIPREPTIKLVHE